MAAARGSDAPPPEPIPAVSLNFTRPFFHTAVPMPYSNERHSPEKLAEIAREIRRDIIRSLVVAKSGHSGGPLGSADIFAVLYMGGVMNHDPQNPAKPGRDRFILSAGHMCPVLYATLANAGFFPKSELLTLRKFGSRLQGHPGRDMHLPGIESSTGSLGQGLSIAVGMAMSDKLVDRNNARVYALTGDGELQEGSIWEAVMSAAHYQLDNFCMIVDNNDCQIDGRVPDVMNIYPLREKFESFNFHVIECDGNNTAELLAAFDEAKTIKGKPTCIIARTYMGNGVSFMQDKFEWHGKPPSEDQAKVALEELA
ncbi:MAG: Transketolase [Chlorobi bacterium OLB7]|nr:MAG: Transketolase [Chlorobi bacterium OLB7]